MSNRALSQQRLRAHRFFASPRRQQGLSLISVIFIMAIAGLLLTCVLKMLPVYIQSWNVQGVLDGIREEQTSKALAFTKSEVRSLLSKRLNINQISVVDGRQFELEKTADGLSISAEYEVREALLANIDVVMKFNNSVMLPAR